MDLMSTPLLDPLVMALGPREALALAGCCSTSKELVMARLSSANIPPELPIVRLYGILEPKSVPTPRALSALRKSLIAGERHVIERLFQKNDIYLDTRNHSIVLDNVARLDEMSGDAISEVYITFLKAIIEKITAWTAAEEDAEKVLTAFGLATRMILKGVRWMIDNEVPAESVAVFSSMNLMVTCFNKVKEAQDTYHLIKDINNAIEFGRVTHEAATYLNAWIKHLQNGKKIYTGPNGGLYQLGRKGRKVYISKC